MPLKDHFPVLDNRRFADIVAEARARIPRYTQEWTDFNSGDAGFALVELFSWMTELLVYRLGRVPELNYLKFLQLIGIDLEPARPARTVIVFPVQKAYAGSLVIVPSRTQVASAEPDDLGPIVFETERALTALKAELDALQAFDGFAYANLTPANVEIGGGFEPFGPFANAGSAILLGLSSNFDLPAGAELAVGVWTASDRILPPAGSGATAYAPAKIVWDYWSGSEWRRLTILGDDTHAFTRSGIVRLRMPAKGEAVRGKLGNAKDKDRFWLRARLERASYEQAPQILAIRLNVVPAIEAQTAGDEVLGGSEGTPDQTFSIKNYPILDGTLTLEVDEGEGFVAWTEVGDFFGSGPDDTHVVLNRATGEVRFGDGRRGRIPVANVARPHNNIVARRYRFGGGARGNLKPGALSTLMGSIAGIDAGKVSNPFAADGGTDEETLEAAMERAPRALKARDRAVTSEDFEHLAMMAGPVRRAKALPLSHPDFPGIEVPGVVSLVIVPDKEGTAPQPSDMLRRTVASFLDQRRLLTTELYVTGPVYAGVSVSLELIIAMDADAAETRLAVEAAVTNYLHPLTGGEDGLGWPFGQPLYYANLYRRVQDVPGVERLANAILTLEGADQPSCSDVIIPAGALIRLDGVTVTLREQAEETFA